MARFNIAIDGPSGVGKSTIADILALKYNMHHLDTGAMYRCVAYYVMQNDIDLNNEQNLKESLDNISICFDEKKVYLNGEDVSDRIRLNDISMYTSKIASLSAVRNKMVKLQQQIAKDKGYILDGRDICSVVLPDAEVKIFLTASSKARAQRRYNEYVEKGIEADYETIFQDIVARDYQDTHRENSPLVITKDATVVDTSDLSIDEVVNEIVQIIEDRV